MLTQSQAIKVGIPIGTSAEHKAFILQQIHSYFVVCSKYYVPGLSADQRVKLIESNYSIKSLESMDVAVAINTPKANSLAFAGTDDWQNRPLSNKLKLNRVGLYTYACPVEEDETSFAPAIIRTVIFRALALRSTFNITAKAPMPPIQRV